MKPRIALPLPLCAADFCCYPLSVNTGTGGPDSEGLREADSRTWMVGQLATEAQ